MKHNTRQRQAIMYCLSQASGPMSPYEIHELAAEEVQGLGIATVYRNLKFLAQEGKIQELVLPGEGARYEPAGQEHHHHFFCRYCDRVFCVPGCLSGLASMTPEGFTLEGHEIVLYGRCEDCRMVRDS